MKTDDILEGMAAHTIRSTCEHCGAWTGTRHDRTCPTAKRARNNRKRGGDWELLVARALESVFPDVRKVGPLGGPDDVTSRLLYVQCKKVAALYPKRLDDLLTSTEQHAAADQFTALALAHPGHERRHKLVVMDMGDFVNLIRQVQGEAMEEDR